MEEMRNAYKILAGKLEEKVHSLNLRVNGTIILNRSQIMCGVLD
jgi:hypothetical protein